MIEMLDECIIEQISINATCEKFRPDHEQFWAELFRVQEVNESDQTHFFGRLLHENDDLKQKVSTLEEKITELDVLKQKLKTLEEKIAHLNKTIEENADKSNKSKRSEVKDILRSFNKRVKYEVKKKFGPFYLLNHQVRDLDMEEMQSIKQNVCKIFSPLPVPLKVAWNDAMNSLRQDRHQLKKKRR